MKKNVLFLCLALVVVISLILVGCSSTPSSTPPPSTSSAAPPASSAPASSAASTPAKVYTFKYSDQNPSDGWEGVHAGSPWLKAITAATQGQVQFQLYYNQSLNKGPDTWSAVQNGTADLGWMVYGYWQGMTPLNSVMMLPFLPFKSAAQASGIWYQLIQKYPSMAAEFKPNIPLAYFTTSPYFLITSKKQVKTLADWQGLKIRVLAGPLVDMMKDLGAVPVNVPMPDTYLDLQKGVIDGMLDPWEASISFKHYEVTKYVTYFAGGPVMYNGVAMNADKWNSLPPDIQKEFNTMTGLNGSLYWGYNQFDTSFAAGPGIAEKAGYPPVNYTVPQDEIDKWSAVAGKPVWDAWVKDMTAKGHPEAQDILSTLQNLIQTYNTPPASNMSSNTYQ